MLIISFVCRLPSGSSSQKYPTMMMKRANPCVLQTAACGSHVYLHNLLELKCNAKAESKPPGSHVLPQSKPSGIKV
jgi:hypothetical protein